MYKRIIIIVLLSMELIFSSCSSLKSIFRKKEEIILPENTDYTLSYEEAVKAHRDRQSSETLYVMKVNKEKSAVNTPLKKRKRHLFKKKRGACGSFNDNTMLLDGVRDIR